MAANAASGTLTTALQNFRSDICVQRSLGLISNTKKKNKLVGETPFQRPS